MAIFCVIFASCIFSEPRAAHFRPALHYDHTMCGSMADIQSPTAEGIPYLGGLGGAGQTGLVGHAWTCQTK